jgi:DNA-binding NarL/FixJ family response regulator
MAQLMAYDADPNLNWDVVKALGHEVQTFNDSGEALDYARANTVDIALLGGPEGIDLIRHLREISSQFKVVVFCDSPKIEEIRQALGLAPCAVLFKPVVAEELDACLKRALLKGKSTIKGSLKL